MKSLRPVFLISMVITLISFGVVFYFMFFGPEKLEFSGKSFEDLAQGGQLLAIGVGYLTFDTNCSGLFIYVIK